MAASPVILKTNPHRPVDFKESSVAKVLEQSGNLNVDIKEDGCQLNLVVDWNGTNADVEFLSREGKRFNGLTQAGIDLTEDPRWSKFFNPHLDAGLFRENGGFMLQAEILIDGKVCAEISGDLRRMEPVDLSKVEIAVFDLIPLDAVKDGTEYEVFQELRRMHAGIQVEALKSRFPEIRWRLVDSVQVFSLEQLTAVYEEFRKLGKEGGVAKDPLCYWKRGKKVGQWKIKPDEDCDGVVVRPMWGTPGLSFEGMVIGFTVLTEHGVEVDAGGITDDLKIKYTAAVCKNPNHFKDWACKITYMERLPSGSYRHPNFDSFRGITDPLIKE
ncbi:putative DNA ligase [Pseudomonas phage phiIBB-PF7A]|uniref:DNA ligase n=1 Tax=Pseudomonas phage phiIBB-PF7A TaxID=942165 RepID=E9KIE5_9CAUD|nr:DNA ligase [Pseudomonas phage phiIBB-PF7A]ADV35670.1 putative DNA ligase [Pseudomonas phage phiIBB-PF7A]